MRISKKIKPEHDRVIKSFDFIIKKFDLDLNLIISPMTPGKLKRYSQTNFTIERSNRGNHDRQTFLIFYNQSLTSSISAGKLKRHAFHEVIHALTWPFIDEYNEVMKYIDSVELYNEMAARAVDTRENVTYQLERKMGPHALPEADWGDDE